MADFMQTFFQEIHKQPLLTAEEEKELFEKAHTGDDQARCSLVERNLGLVVSVAKKYITKDFPLEELISEGSFGLMKAVDTFDLERNNKFSTYAVWWIRQSIIRFLHESRSIRLPENIINDISKYKKWLAEIDHTPTVTETAQHFKITEKKVQDMLDAMQDIVSTNQPVKNGDEGSEDTLEDFIPDRESNNFLEDIEKEEQKQAIEQILSTLPQREAQILRMRFGFDGEPKTLEDIGKEFGLSRERIRQLESKALQKMRHPMRSTKLKEYLSD